MKPPVPFFIILLFVTLLGVAGCKKHPAPSRSYIDKTETKDSTTVKVVERLVPVLVPGKTMEIEKEVPCPNKEAIHVNGKGNNVSINATLGNGKLKIKAKCEEYEAMVKVKDSTITHLKSQLSKKVETQIHVKYKVHWYDIACRYATGILLFLGIILILLKRL